VCSYHSWRYDSAGNCIHVTDRELFHKEALDGSLNLRAVRCETHGGFVFINMDGGAAPLRDFIGEVAEITSGYQLERMEVRADAVLELACNWKTTLDAFSENYHVHMTHQFAMPITEDKLGQLDFYPGGHTRRIVPLGNPAVRRGHATAIHPMQAHMLEAAGIDPGKFAGGAMDVRRAVQRAKRRMGGQAAMAYQHLSDNQLTDDWAVNLFPNMHWSLHAEGALVMRYHPHVSDPNRCSLHILVLAHAGLPFNFYLPEATEFEPSGRPKRIFVRHDDPDVKERIGQLLWEDIRNTRETQRGLQSRGFGRMRLSEHEQAIMYQYATMDRYLNTEYGSVSAHSAVKG
jgi:phenylpropionate dioxygenase-like ring-hydroxylating dioxygenase large terminal subunit